MYKKFFKRFLDFILSLLALIALSPVYVILYILIFCKLGSPVIFKQERPGKDEKIFKMYKFRTMTNKKNDLGELLPDSQRLTTFGKILRSTSLDELPELWNICKGDMSIIGPRPLLVKYLPFYTTKEHHRHDERPGLTGLAQVSGRNFLNWNDRFMLDVQYVNNITFLNDLKIVFLTIKKVFTRSDVMELDNMNEVKFKDLDIERAVKK